MNGNGFAEDTWRTHCFFLLNSCKIDNFLQQSDSVLVKVGSENQIATKELALTSTLHMQHQGTWNIREPQVVADTTKQNKSEIYFNVSCILHKNNWHPVSSSFPLRNSLQSLCAIKQFMPNLQHNSMLKRLHQYPSGQPQRNLYFLPFLRFLPPSNKFLNLLRGTCTNCAGITCHIHHAIRTFR